MLLLLIKRGIIYLLYNVHCLFRASRLAKYFTLLNAHIQQTKPHDLLRPESQYSQNKDIQNETTLKPIAHLIVDIVSLCRPSQRTQHTGNRRIATGMSARQFVQYILQN